MASPTRMTPERTTCASTPWCRSFINSRKPGHSASICGQVALGAFEGTLWLSWYLRAMGMTIGRRVLLGYGFAQVVDPDMLVIEDEATVSAMFQAHTFEDRVLKIDRVYVRRGATLADGTVPLSGADVGPGAYVAAHSVVLKRERLAAGTRYEGAPTRPA